MPRLMELVYRGEGEEEGVGVDANQGTGQDEVAPETPVKENTTMTMPVRKTPPRDAKSSNPSPKKHTGIRGLPVKEKPTDTKIVWAKSLGSKVFCCKHAFSGKHKCTVAHCESCKNLLCPEPEGRGRGRRGGGGDDRVGTVVVNCDKGDCGKHTERDLVDFIIHIIDTSYLKATREKKQERGWENVAEHCWKCGGLF